MVDDKNRNDGFGSCRFQSKLLFERLQEGCNWGVGLRVVVAEGGGMRLRREE